MAWKVIREVGGNGSTVKIDANPTGHDRLKTSKSEFQNVCCECFGIKLFVFVVFHGFLLSIIIPVIVVLYKML